MIVEELSSNPEYLGYPKAPLRDLHICLLCGWMDGWVDGGMLRQPRVNPLHLSIHILAEKLHEEMTIMRGCMLERLSCSVSSDGFLAFGVPGDFFLYQIKGAAVNRTLVVWT